MKLIFIQNRKQIQIFWQPVRINRKSSSAQSLFLKFLPATASSNKNTFIRKKNKKKSEKKIREMSALGWFPKWYLIRFLFVLILQKVWIWNFYFSNRHKDTQYSTPVVKELMAEAITCPEYETNSKEKFKCEFLKLTLRVGDR